MFRSLLTLLGLLAAFGAHAQLSADYYYREECPDPQVTVAFTDSTRYATPLPDSAAVPAPSEAAAVTPDTARTPALAAYSPEAWYQLGRHDARQYYQPAKGVFWGTVGATIISSLGTIPLVGGLATMAAITAVAPPPAALHVPTPFYLLDPEYQRGYVRQA